MKKDKIGIKNKIKVDKRWYSKLKSKSK